MAFTSRVRGEIPDQTGPVGNGGLSPAVSLSDAHHDRLVRFGIPDALTSQAHVRSVTDREARDAGIRFSRASDLTGLLFEYCHPSTGHLRGVRVRRDHPEVEGGKPKNKYVASLDPNHLYFAPVEAGDLSDTSVPIVIVEAESSALAVRAATERAERTVVVIATGGAWGWRGRIGKALSPSGTRVDEKGPVPDLDIPEWKDRDVVILFDSNIGKNAQVAAGEQNLARELAGRGAQVRLGRVPAVPGVNGPDDLIAEQGDEALIRIIDSAEPAQQSQGGDGQSQADRLVELVADAELFHRDVDEPYATVPVNGHFETWKIGSRGFEHWLCRAFFQEHRKAVTRNAIRDAINVIAGMAIHEGPSMPVHVRVASSKGSIYLDLADESWRSVEVDSTGWRVVDRPPVRFVRSRGTLPLPMPVSGGDLDELQRFVNITDACSWSLCKAFLISAMCPDRPQPVLALTGEQGSAKSTAARTFVGVIDPHKAPIRGLPREPRDLMIAASNSRIVAFDNVSHLPQWLSDALCSLSTGGGFSTRELYTDGDEKIFEAIRPVILNGITDVATRPDLLDRSLILHLSTISDDRRLEEADLRRRFEAAHPRILGALMDAVSEALRNETSVQLESKPRMADFARWAVAAEPSHSQEAIFLSSYQENRSGVNNLAIDSSVIGSTFVAWVDRHEDWKGTVGDLLEQLNDLADDSIQRGRSWPKSPQKLSSELKRLIPNLRREGIDVEYGTHSRQGRILRIHKRREMSSQPSPSSRPLPVNDLRTVEGDNPAVGVRHTSSPVVTEHTRNSFDSKGRDDCDEGDEVFAPPATPEIERFDI